MAKTGFDAVGDQPARIIVIGVGGAGGNAVNNMIRSNLEGVDFAVCNTDNQALSTSDCQKRIQLGVNITQGLGAGARADIGRAAAEEAIDEIIQVIQGANMVFVTAGLGGGTGSGAAPVIARIAREQGALTVGVATKPFQFEGRHRMRSAEQALEELQNNVDTLIVTPNQNLFRLANEHTTFADAFKMADDVLYCGVRGVTDLMLHNGFINLDFADVRTVMSEMGKAMMGTGESDGEHRAIEAAEAAISNPLLEGVSMRGAKAVLINITGGMDLALFEMDEAVQRVTEEVDPDANIIWGTALDTSLEGKVRISVVATGIDTEANEADIPRRTQPARAPRSATLRSENAADRNPPAAPAHAPVAETQAAPRRPAEIAAERPAKSSADLAAAINERKAQEAERRRRAEAEADSQRRRPSVINAPRRAAEVERGDARRITPEAPAYERRRAAEAEIEAPAAEEAFIAPPPARAEPAAEIVDAPARAPAARPESGGARPPNLFERVTGATPPAREPAPRAARSESEELLDIPAFLRRQSN